MTFLQILNKVLIRLREDQVTSSTSDDYGLLVGDLLNETIREVQEAWDWNALRTTIQVPVVANTFRYTLTGTDPSSKILSVIDDSNNRRLKQMTPKEMTNRFLTYNTSQAESLYWSLNGIDTSNQLLIDIWPIPNSSEILMVNVKIPQGIVTDDSTEIIGSPMPYLLGTYAKAIQERGEDMGDNLRFAENRYKSALADAIAIDVRNSGDYIDWHF